MVRPFFSFMAKARSALVVRIFLIVSLAVVLPAGILFAVALTLFENVVRESIDAELATALDGAERDLTNFLADLTAVSGALADDGEVARIFTPGLSEYDRVKALDKAVDGLFMALPGRDAVRWTFLTEDGIYSSWSRNFNDYRFLRDAPLAVKARALGGHLAWEGFNPSFQAEERNWSSLVSLGRLFPTDSSVKRLGVMMLSVEKEAFRKYLKDRRASDNFATLLIARGGEVVVDAGNRAVPAEISAAAVAAFAEAPDRADLALNAGGYLVVGRRLSSLPVELVEQDWSVAVLYSYGVLSRRFDRLRAYFLPASAFLFVTAIVVSWFVSRRVVRPVSALSRSMDAWRPEIAGVDGASYAASATVLPGHPAPFLPAPVLSTADASRSDEIGTLHRAFSRLQADIVVLLDRLKRESEVRELYRYRSLRAQLNPHFLFNSLNSVRWLAIIRKADNIVAAVDDLSGLLGYSMGKGGDSSTLREELESVERYLSIQNLRFGGRFRLKRLVQDDAFGAEALRFMLQPIAENCVLHGYKGASGEGIVEIAAGVVDGSLLVSVADRGVGLDPVALEQRMAEDADADASREGGLGLRNVRDMLALTYGGAADLTLSARDGGGTIVRIRLPYRKGGSA